MALFESYQQLSYDFSFKGVYASTLGLHYVPLNKNTYVYNVAQYKADTETFNGHDGAYYYGETVQPKTFSLRCYFQNEHVNRGIFQRIDSFFKRGATGQLIFKNRPYVYYIATVSDVDFSNILNSKNGFVTISMTAYWPFSRSIYDSIDECSDRMLVGNIMLNTGLLNKKYIPSTQIIDDGLTLTLKKTFLLYNGGNELSPVIILIAGDVDLGVVILNTTTKDTMTIVALSNSVTTELNKYLVVDSLNGKTYLTLDGKAGDLAFLYHDSGFIWLKPSYPIIRKAYASINTSEGTVSFNFNKGSFLYANDWTGYYFFIGITPHKLSLKIDGYTYKTLDINEVDGNLFTTDIVVMNLITVYPKNSMLLTKLNFKYYPTFS